MRLSLFTNVSYVVHQQIPLKLTKKGHAKHLPIARHGKILDPSYLETNHTSYLCYTSDFFWIFFTISSFYYFMVVMWVGGGGGGSRSFGLYSIQNSPQPSVGGDPSERFEAHNLGNFVRNDLLLRDGWVGDVFAFPIRPERRRISRGRVFIVITPTLRPGSYPQNSLSAPPLAPPGCPHWKHLGHWRGKLISLHRRSPPPAAVTEEEEARCSSSPRYHPHPHPPPHHPRPTTNTRPPRLSGLIAPFVRLMCSTHIGIPSRFPSKPSGSPSAAFDSERNWFLLIRTGYGYFATIPCFHRVKWDQRQYF